MIISASYKTDIPAFYAEWFLDLLDAGFCKMVNPFYSSQVSTIPLSRDKVDGFVFWTRNIGPFMEALRIVHERGYPFIIQHSITGYPKELEHAVIAAEKSMNNLKIVAEKYGPKVAVWRYDPIVFTSLTTEDFHRKNFERLAHQLQGVTDEVTVSFANIYKKTDRNMSAAARVSHFTWYDPDAETKKALLRDLVQIAHSAGMRISLCSQPELLVPGAQKARCIDGARLTAISGIPFKVKMKGKRPGCTCHDSRDIGEYDTCPHGCVYCYANTNKTRATKRHKEHDPRSEFLYPVTGVVENNPVDDKSDTIQYDLFDEISV